MEDADRKNHMEKCVEIDDEILNCLVEDEKIFMKTELEQAKLRHQIYNLCFESDKTQALKYQTTLANFQKDYMSELELISLKMVNEGGPEDE